MRVPCPNCAAEYEVPSAQLHPRRKVRCTRCETVWIPVQEAESATSDHDAPEPHDPQPEDDYFEQARGATAMDRLAAASAPRSSVGLRAAWVASVILLVVSGAATVTWRGRIVQSWPASGLLLGEAHSRAATVPAPHRTAEAPAHPAVRSE